MSFRTDTLELAALTATGKPQLGIRFVTDALVAGGGVPVEAAGSIVAGIGISGTPSGKANDDCACTGIRAIEDDLMF